MVTVNFFFFFYLTWTGQKQNDNFKLLCKSACRVTAHVIKKSTQKGPRLVTELTEIVTIERVHRNVISLLIYIVISKPILVKKPNIKKKKKTKKHCKLSNCK